MLVAVGIGVGVEVGGTGVGVGVGDGIGFNVGIVSSVGTVLDVGSATGVGELGGRVGIGIVAAGLLAAGAACRVGNTIVGTGRVGVTIGGNVGMTNVGTGCVVGEPFMIVDGSLRDGTLVGTGVGLGSNSNGVSVSFGCIVALVVTGSRGSNNDRKLSRQVSDVSGWTALKSTKPTITPKSIRVSCFNGRGFSRRVAMG